MRQRQGLILITCGWLCLLGGTSGAWAQATLPQLEQAAAQHALAVRSARQDVAIQQYRKEGVETQNGARVSGSVGLASTREPVTEDVVRQYERAGLQVGVRWPLLSAAEQSRRALTAANGDLTVAKLRLTQAQTDAITQTRLAYVDAVRTSQRMTLGRMFLGLEPRMAGMLAGRARDGLLLDADRQAFQSMFETARRDAVREEVAHEEALAQLRTLTGDALPALDESLPRWDSACLRQIKADDAVAGPSVDAAQAQLAAAKEAGEKQQWVGVDAGVSLTQSLSRDLGSSSGRSTGISLDVSMPFEWQRMRAAARAEAQARVDKAELELEAARQADAALSRQALAEWRVREADRATYEQRLNAAGEALRVAMLRAQKLDGDVLEKKLQARYAVYGAAVEASLALQRLERAQARVLALWPGCEAQPGQPATMLLLQDPLTLLEGGLPTQAGNAVEQGPGLAWFIWRAAPWLASPSTMLRRLPVETRRIMVSLDGPQLEAASTPDGRRALLDFLQAAHAQRLHVDLLLGEPLWALDAWRPRMLALIEHLKDLPFDGVNLDLERSQLPADTSTHTWRRGVLDTVRAVAALGQHPITLTMHDRDLISPGFAIHLKRAGVSEIMPMIYATSEKTVQRRLGAVVSTVTRRGGMWMQVALAQSVEPELPATESWHAPTRQDAVRAVLDRARALADGGMPLSAVAVQSFEALEVLPP